jgi:hypothetical protein
VLQQKITDTRTFPAASTPPLALPSLAVFCIFIRVQVGKHLSDLHTKRSPTQIDIYQRLY